MRTPVKTIMLITNKVTTEIAARRTRKSNTADAGLPAQFQEVPLIRIRPSGTAL